MLLLIIPDNSQMKSQTPVLKLFSRADITMKPGGFLRDCLTGPGVTARFGALTRCPVFRVKPQSLKTSGTRNFEKTFTEQNAGPTCAKIWLVDRCKKVAWM